PANNAVLETVRLVSLTLNGQHVSQLVSPTGFHGANSSFSRSIGPAKVSSSANITTSGSFVANRAIFNGSVSVSSNADAFFIDSELNQTASITARDQIALR